MKKITIVILLFSVFSCTNPEKYENITGEWECISWLTQSNQIDKCNHNVYFKFNEDKTYQSRLGVQQDSGKYKITNDILYATPDNKMEIAVEITKLNSDTVVFLMNNGGAQEILTLVKKH